MSTKSALKALNTDGSIALTVDWVGALQDSLAGTASSTIDIAASTVAPRSAPAAALTDVLFLTEPGSQSAISVSDINQGQLGDCFLLSSMGEIALYDPAAISQMIHVNANGTETVQLFESPNGHTPGFGATSFAVSDQVVTNNFSTASVNNGATQDVVGNQKEIWAQVLEKAYAQANGGYGGINQGGNPVIALQQLTGETAQWESASQATVSSLISDQAASDLIVMDTPNSSNLPFNLVGDHAYMFEGLVTSNGTACVKLGNPWGFDQPSLIPVTQLSRGIVEVDIGHLR